MGSYTVERSATIHAPAQDLHAFVDDFHRWNAWSPWEDLDPDMERTFTGADSGVGARYAWSGNKKAGSGTMAITDSTPTSVVLDLAFVKPFKSSSTLHFTFAPVDADTTAVTWHMLGRTSGAFAVAARFMNFDKMVGPDFEKGLRRLKAAAESTTPAG